MKNLIYTLILGLFISSCTTEIKNHEARIEIEEGAKVELPEAEQIIEVAEEEEETLTENQLLGFWVGYFEQDDNENSYSKNVYVDEGYFWNRENKINISIDEINDSLVIGHSVVAGNDRPFKGKIEKEEDGGFSFKVKEPGDHKYDGEFIFRIYENELEGKWTAYKEIDIQKRKYKLEKRNFEFNPEIMLEKSKEYVNWNKAIITSEGDEMNGDEFGEWITKEFASATNLIYEINASNTLLSKSVVENLKRGDLTIIRNTIYARHGYSFKNRPLRVFFDAQNWYIPVHTNIKNDFTKLEKENIQLLLRYEKNAAEYYDYFGRG